MRHANDPVPWAWEELHLSHAQGREEGPGPWESYVDDAATTPHDKVRSEVYWPLKR